MAPHSYANLPWIKATASLPTGACVELAPFGEQIALRDSKRPHVDPLLFTRAEIAAFLDGAKGCEFDHLV
jgi:hypothetical protein